MNALYQAAVNDVCVALGCCNTAVRVGVKEVLVYLILPNPLWKPLFSGWLLLAVKMISGCMIMCFLKIEDV